MISNFLMDLLGEVAGEIIGHFLPDSKMNSIFITNIERLKDEKWFSDLYEDYRYNYIICRDGKVRSFLSTEKSVKLLTSMEEERDEFIRLVKDEHAKFVRLR